MYIYIYVHTYMLRSTRRGLVGFQSEGGTTAIIKGYWTPMIQLMRPGLVDVYFELISDLCGVAEHIEIDLRFPLFLLAKPFQDNGSVVISLVGFLCAWKATVSKISRESEHV